MEEPPPTPIISRYLLLVFIWSTTPLAVVLSIKDLHPMWALACRFALAAPLSALCLKLLGEHLPLTKQALRSYVAGTLSLFGAMTFTYLGAAYLPSSLISLLFGLSPLMVGILAHGVLKTQLLRMEQWLGLVLAFMGLMVIFNHGSQGQAQSLGIVFVLLGVSCYIVSVFWVKHENANLHPLAQTTGSLILSAIAMMFVLPFYWYDKPTHIPSTVTLLALFYSVAMASVVAMFCYFYLIKTLAPATVSLTTFITPVLALVWGFWLNGERFSIFTAIGMAVIMLGMCAYFLQQIKSVLFVKNA
ncbi:MAG: EamA family transporter [Pseudomonadales bacterium]|nr:EamA family transporter [Pseudomonadales bacterium]